MQGSEPKKQIDRSMVRSSCSDGPGFDGRSGVSNREVFLHCFQNSRSPSTTEHFYHQGPSQDCRYRGRLAGEMVLHSRSRKCIGGREQNFTGEVFWARVYLVSTIGLDEAMVRTYIRNQEDERYDQMKPGL